MANKEERLQICKTVKEGNPCPHLWNRPVVGPICRLCGCVLSWKAKLDSGHCPLKHW